MNKRKKLIIIISVTVISILSLIGGSTIYYFSQKESYSGKLKAGVRSEVTIVRDNKGIPHITTQNRDDLYYTLGLLHARDRFFLMKYFRSLAKGELTKFIGPKGKEIDMLFKAIDFESIARKIVLPDPYLTYIKSYVKGINFVAAQQVDSLVMKDIWKVEDIIAVQLLREWSHAFLNNKELVFQLPYEKRSRIDGKMLPVDFVYYFQEDQKRYVNILLKIKKLLIEHVGKWNQGFSIAVPGQLSRRNKPIISYSYINSLSLYPELYPFHVTLNDKKMELISLSGSPFIIGGRGKTFSFFSFSLNADVQDFCIEQVKTENGAKKYLNGFVWRNFKDQDGNDIKDENYKGKFYSANGLVLNNIFPDQRRRRRRRRRSFNAAITMKTKYPDASYIKSLFDLPFSESMNLAWRQILNMDSYPRAYIFMNDKNIMKTYGGKMPQRPFSQLIFRDGRFNRWGRDADCALYYQMGKRITYAGSFISEGLPYWVKNYIKTDKKRIERINFLLKSRKIIGRRHTRRILNDIYSVEAERFVPLFLNLLKKNPVTSARLSRIYFRNWKYEMDQKNIAPSIFALLLKNFIYETYKDNMPALGESIKENYTLVTDNFFDFTKLSTNPYFDDITTDGTKEDMDTIFIKAFIKTMRSLNRKKGPIMDDWKWGSVHSGHYNIPVRQLNFLSNLLFSLKDRGFSGGNDTLHYSAYSSKTKPSMVTSIKGFFRDNQGEIYMNFDYSITPLSEFYKGNKVKRGFVDFISIKKDHVLKVIPKK